MMSKGKGPRGLAIPHTEERVVLATGRYIGEDGDDERLDPLFLVMPIYAAYADARLRGRPPLAPFALAAAALAFDLRRPPRRPVALANRRAPNARSTNPGT